MRTVVDDILVICSGTTSEAAERNPPPSSPLPSVNWKSRGSCQEGQNGPADGLWNRRGLVCGPPCTSEHTTGMSALRPSLTTDGQTDQNDAFHIGEALLRALKSPICTRTFWRTSFNCVKRGTTTEGQGPLSLSTKKTPSKIQPIHLGQKWRTDARVLRQVGIRSYQVRSCDPSSDEEPQPTTDANATGFDQANQTEDPKGPRNGTRRAKAATAAVVVPNPSPAPQCPVATDRGNGDDNVQWPEHEAWITYVTK